MKTSFFDTQSTDKKLKKTSLINGVMASVLLMSFSSITLTACADKPADTHDEHGEEHHDEHGEEHHDEHGEEHHDEHGEEHHDEHGEEHHDEHGEEHHDEHGEEHHDEHHGHNHGHSTKKQVIPADYSVNFAVSNYPMYLLSEAVTKDTKTTVYRLLGAGDVGHHGSLSPSDVKMVNDSKYVVWFGAALESNLSNTLTKADNVVTILDNKNIKILDHRNEKAEVVAGQLDPHVWLDPNNAKEIVKVLADLHATAKPELAETYKNNTEAFIKELDTLVQSYKAQHNETKKYWSSHDAFQYLESSMNLEFAGALTTDHEIPTKASQILWLTKNRPYETMCLLSQGVQKEGIIDKLKPVNTQVLIEDMSDSDSFIDAWNKSARGVAKCLETQ